MEKIKQFLLKALSSKSDVSSKRLISFLAFTMMSIGFISNLYFGLKVEEHMFKSMEWIVEIGMGTVLLDPLTRRFGSNNLGGEPQPPQPQTPTSGGTQTQTVSTGDTQTQSVDMPTGPDPVE
jgi:hypothetical protein